MVERQEKRPPFRRRTAQSSANLLVCYFRLTKTTAPAMVRTALNSTEKLTERLISISPMRHNCPNTMRKQASDGLRSCIASLLCRATAPTTTSGPFFVSEPRMPELTAGAWAFRRSVPTEIERIVLECLQKHVLSQKADLQTQAGPPFGDPVSVG